MPRLYLASGNLDAMLRVALLALVVTVLAGSCVKPLYSCAKDAQCPAPLRCIAGECGAGVEGEGEGAVSEGEGGEGEGAASEGEGGEGEGAAEGEGEGEGCPAGEIPRTFFPDLDGDGFTGPSTVICASDATPPGYSETEALAPIFLVAPTTLTSVNNRWNPGSAVLQLDGTTASVQVKGALGQTPLTMSGFSCEGAPKAVTGVAVRVTGRLQDSTSRMIAVNVILLLPGNTQSTVSQIVEAWPTESQPNATFVVGGPSSTFGQALTPAIVCDPAFGVKVELTSIDGSQRTALVDFVEVDVFGGDDCDDGDASKFSPQLFYPDVDADGHGDESAPQAVCGADETVPAGLLVKGDDCDDADANVHPGQTAFFTAPRGDGTYDYDCNGTDDPQPIATQTGCADNCGCGFTSGTTTGVCGQSIDVPTCDGACNDSTSSVTQACR